MPSGEHNSSKTGVYTHWSEDPRKVRLMQWCLTPPSDRHPRTRAELADVLGVSNRTLGNWMSLVDFQADWRHEAQAVIGAPERAQAVLDTLYAAATDPENRNHVQAAKLYLEATKAITPKARPVTITNPAALSDAELDELIARAAAVAHEDEAIERATSKLAEDDWREDESGCPWSPSTTA